MRNSISIILIICLVCISITQGCLTLYQDYGSTGNSTVICTSGNVPAAFNDQVSTIVVPTGWSATLYQDYNFGGMSLPIGAGTWSAPADWNDQLSSLQISPGCPVFYQDYGLRGSSFVMCATGNVPANFNDQVSSIYVPPGWAVTLFQDYNNAGTSLPIGAGTWSAPTAWNDQLSSVAIASQ